ncbi:MAG TPA: hypothetical protein VH817_07605 [Thermoleophilaceae bacterium]
MQPRIAGAARNANARKVLLALAVVLASACTAAVAGAVAPASVNGTRVTAVVSRNANGPSTGGAFSQDGRTASLYAFTSAASNLVDNDSNGRLDVFVLHRNGMGGAISRASVSSNGVQGNGDSSGPSVDGTNGRSPHCVAFQSTSTNLDPADTSPDSDIYLRNLSRGTTRVIAPGAVDATDPTIDGACELMTYEAGGVVYVVSVHHGAPLAIAPGTQPDQETDGRGVAYVRNGQVWYQRYARGKHGLHKRGPERLVSAGHGAGNGASSHPSVNANGEYIAFESTATNLCNGLCKGISGDRNGATSDVFRRTMSSGARSHDRMQMASFSYGANAQGNGASNNPVISSAGQFILFDSTATNLRPKASMVGTDPNGHVRDVFLWNFSSNRGYGNVSRESRPPNNGAFSAPSVAPATSAHGNYVAFTCNAAGIAADGGGGRAIPNVFMRFLGGA